MSKRDYEKLADAIKHQADLTRGMSTLPGAAIRLALNDLANELADSLGGDNPRFDRTKFKAACGLL